MFYAAGNRNDDEVRRLLGNGVDPNFNNPDYVSCQRFDNCCVSRLHDRVTQSSFIKLFRIRVLLSNVEFTRNDDETFQWMADCSMNGRLLMGKAYIETMLSAFMSPSSKHHIIISQCGSLSLRHMVCNRNSWELLGNIIVSCCTEAVSSVRGQGYRQSRCWMSTDSMWCECSCPGRARNTSVRMARVFREIKQENALVFIPLSIAVGLRVTWHP